MDGVMIGRTAYHAPADILCAADARIYGKAGGSDPVEAVHQMIPYIERHLADHGGRLGQITRHMLGLFAGRPGARAWRRVLSEGAPRAGAGPQLLLEALDRVTGGDIAGGDAEGCAPQDGQTRAQKGKYDD
jgi:tRNA-dihydrouridine synthase A